LWDFTNQNAIQNEATWYQVSENWIYFHYGHVYRGNISNRTNRKQPETMGIRWYIHYTI
jgi:hypothetical protein